MSGKFHVDGPRSRKKRQVRNPADKSSIDIDWSALLQNSTFNKWDSLDSDINVTSKYYDSVDDELEAYLTYAYITAPMDPAVVEMAGHKKKDFIASCKFGGFQCSPRNFTYFHSHRYGNCYTFNHKDSDKVLFSKFSGPDLGTVIVISLFIASKPYRPLSFWG
ncbi:amiloride-sensitive sodium channel subunit gamma [Aplysia californica]|uniref:Amiloride-sensitive sodium channel subunit gamma n=1 Tax=Aplysia californica TaxID=6500 RepID=A0ABM1W030_APLCA|nr:amiloride-sensitive sodium channel subunit gamma [Aplysia californica]